MKNRHLARFVCAFVGLGALVAQPAAQSMPPGGAPQAARSASPDPAASGPSVPGDYVIGADDALSIVFWKDTDMTTEVVVRPDGKITLPLLNDLQAAGLTPDQLRDVIVEQAKRYISDPSATVVVKQINSRKVFITGQVEKPGMYPLSSSMTVVQLISMAGGLKEFAKAKEIVVMRTENGQQIAYPFNYGDIIARRHLSQNIALKPGDTVVVP